MKKSKKNTKKRKKNCTAKLGNSQTRDIRAEIYTAHPYYGSRRIIEQLKREGYSYQPESSAAPYEGNGYLRYLSRSHLEQKRHVNPRLSLSFRKCRSECPQSDLGINMTYIRLYSLEKRRCCRLLSLERLGRIDFDYRLRCSAFLPAFGRAQGTP